MTEHGRAGAADGTIAEPLPLRVARELDAMPVAPPLADARQSDVLHHVSGGIDSAAVPEGPALTGSTVRPVHPVRAAVARTHADQACAYPFRESPPQSVRMTCAAPRASG